MISKNRGKYGNTTSSYVGLHQRHHPVDRLGYTIVFHSSLSAWFCSLQVQPSSSVRKDDADAASTKSKTRSLVSTSPWMPSMPAVRSPLPKPYALFVIGTTSHRPDGHGMNAGDFQQGECSHNLPTILQTLCDMSSGVRVYCGASIVYELTRKIDERVGAWGIAEKPEIIETGSQCSLLPPSLVSAPLGCLAR